MKTFTVKVQTPQGKTTYQALAYSSGACISHAFTQFADALGVTAVFVNRN